MIVTSFSLLSGISLCTALAVAAPQGRAEDKPKPGDPAAVEAPFRVVERDGSMRAGKLVFRGAGFLVEPHPDVRPANDPAAGAEPEPDPPAPEAEEGEGGDRSGGGEGREGGGRSGGGRDAGAAGRLGLEYITRRDGPLGRIDRVEQAGRSVFQANVDPYTSKYTGDAGYTSDYAELGFVLPDAQWRFHEATNGGAVALRRDGDGDIVGRIRVWLLAEGDDANASRPLDKDAATPARLLRKVDRRRFATLDVATETDEELDSGVRVRRVIRAGSELVSGAPCHLEANVPLDAPLFPVFEILARGPDRDAILEQCRTVLATFRYTRDRPVPPRPLTGLEESEEEDSGEGLRPRDMMSALQSLSQDAVGEYVVKGRYENPWLGISVKATLPEDWVFYRATIDGFSITRTPKAYTGWFDLGYATLGVLDGVARGKEPGAWVVERYLAGLPPVDDPKAMPKAKKGKLGSYSTREFLYSGAIGRSGSEAQLAVHVIESGARTICVNRLAVGQGNQPPQRLDEAMKWLKGLAISTPKPKPPQ